MTRGSVSTAANAEIGLSPIRFITGGSPGRKFAIRRSTGTSSTFCAAVIGKFSTTLGIPSTSACRTSGLASAQIYQRQKENDRAEGTDSRRDGYRSLALRLL